MPSRARPAPDSTLIAPESARYLELVRRCPLRPIRDEAALVAAQAMIDELLEIGPFDAMSPDERDYLDVLSDLVANYEDIAHPVSEPHPGDVLRHLLDDRGIDPAKLAADLGVSASTVTAILAGKRRPSKAVVLKLASYFQLTAETFA